MKIQSSNEKWEIGNKNSNLNNDILLFVLLTVVYILETIE